MYLGMWSVACRNLPSGGIRLLTELLHKIYLYHQQIMFLLVRNLTIKYWIGENALKNA
jgi:hypothetical protein